MHFSVAVASVQQHVGQIKVDNKYLLNLILRWTMNINIKVDNEY